MNKKMTSPIHNNLNVLCWNKTKNDLEKMFIELRALETKQCDLILELEMELSK